MRIFHGLNNASTGTLELQLTAKDPDGDEVEYYLLSSEDQFPDLAFQIQLEKTGL